MKKKIIALALAVLLTLGMGLNAQAALFPDVPSDHWASDYIQEASDRGIIAGYEDGSFRPEGNVTYAEFATMVCRALFPEALAAQEAVQEASGIDVAWYASPMAVCDWYGVFWMTSLDQGARTRSDPMTRCDLAVAIVNAMESAGKRMPGEWETAWAAVSIPDLADYSLMEVLYIPRVYALGIMSGMDDSGRFGGQSNMTRAQACKVLLGMTDAEDAPEAQIVEYDPEPQEPEPEPPAVPVTPEVPEVPETPETPETPQVPQRPDQPALDAQSVYNAMTALKGEYYEGRHWTNDDYYAWNGGVFSGGYGCAGFAFILSDAAFGDLPARTVEPVRFEDVRVGDILRVNGNTHSVIVLEVHSDHVVIAEGNYNSSIHWGRTMTWSEVEQSDYLMTRYPV